VPTGTGRTLVDSIVEGRRGRAHHGKRAQGGDSLANSNQSQKGDGNFAHRDFLSVQSARGNPKDFPLSSAVYVIVIFSMCGREIFNKAPSPEMESPRSSEFIRISDTRRDERRGAARRS